MLQITFIGGGSFRRERWLELGLNPPASRVPASDAFRPRKIVPLACALFTGLMPCRGTYQCFLRPRKGTPFYSYLTMVPLIKNYQTAWKCSFQGEISSSIDIKLRVHLKHQAKEFFYWISIQLYCGFCQFLKQFLKSNLPGRGANILGGGWILLGALNCNTQYYKQGLIPGILIKTN